MKKFLGIMVIGFYGITCRKLVAKEIKQKIG